MKTYPMKARIRAEGGVTRVDIMDDIGEDPFFGGGISAAAFSDKLAGLRGPLDVHISSAGGMVDQGLAIYNALASYPGPVTTYNDGLAASIASVIMQAGSRRVASPVSAFMVHDAWGAAQGDAADMEAMRSALDKNSDIIARAYANRAGGTVEQWRQVMKATAWYDADEALAAGLVDEIAGGAFKPAAAVDLDAVAAIAPTRIMARLRAAASQPDPYDGDDPCPTCKGKKTIRGGNMTCPDCKGSGHAPADGAAARSGGPRAASGQDGDGEGPSGQKCKTCKGKGRLPHPATGKNGAKCPSCDGTGRYDPDGDGDDDSTAAGDTDHDYVMPDGSPGPMALTEERVRAILREEVARMAAAKADESPWDGAKAMANGAAADDPAAFYAGICAGRKSGDAAVQSSWALPYRYHPDDPPNAAGVKAALGRLGQTQGLTNAAEAKRTLQAAMRQVNPDWEPGNSTDKSVFGQRLEQMRAAMPALRGTDA